MTAPLSKVGIPGDFGDDADTADVEPSAGRLLSVAELQQALFVARAASTAPALAARRLIGRVGGLDHPSSGQSLPAVADRARSASARRSARRAPCPALDQGANSTAQTGAAAPSTLNVAQGWIAVLGAHGGAGASTVALAVADAAAAHGRSVHLISRAADTTCGLLAVTSVELGVTDDGQWRRGRRGTQVIVDRVNDRSSVTASSWLPTESTPAGKAPLTVVDLGPGAVPTPQLLASAAAVVVVCRVTVPGMQQAERVLSEFQQPGALGGPVLLAAVGPRRWSGVVIGSLGRRARRLQHDGHIVTVPIIRQLERTGLTSAALPRAVTGAGRTLLELLDFRPAVPAPTPLPPLRRDAAWRPAGSVTWSGDSLAKVHCA